MLMKRLQVSRLLVRTGITLLAFLGLTMPGSAQPPTGQSDVLNKTATEGVTAVEADRVKLSPMATLPPNAKVAGLWEQLFQRSQKAKQSEAEQYIGSINRAEQAFFLEKEQFTTSIQELGIGIKSETDNYRYRIFLLQRPGVSRPELKTAVWSIAIPKQPTLKSYVGVVWLFNIPGSNELTSNRILCESSQPTQKLPPAPTFRNTKEGTVANCPKGFALHLL